MTGTADRWAPAPAGQPLATAPAAPVVSDPAGASPSRRAKPPRPPGGSKAPKPPGARRAAKGARALPSANGTKRVPQPPKRIPKSLAPRAPLSPTALLARSALSLLALLLFGLLANLTVLSHLQHVISQQQLRSLYTEQLAAGTAPVSEGDFEDVLLADGAPVARIEIPDINVDEIVVEGTSSGVTAKGPGHRRDTSLPGQVGVSVLMGRASAYGGPFGRIQQLSPGASISIVTGQGEHIYEVIGVRYAGDLAPAPPTAGESRLILETVRGTPYMPTGLVRVDARLVSPVQAIGVRDTTFRTLPAQDKELAGDTRTVWGLVFALQFLVAAEVLAVWALRCIGGAKVWVVFAPVLLLAGLLAADQLIRLLPNLM